MGAVIGLLYTPRRPPPIARVRWIGGAPTGAYLDAFNVDRETKRVLGLALETARIALGVTNSGDLANKIIAKQIIELAKVGERNPIFCVKAH